jgi:hypothetical protein
VCTDHGDRVARLPFVTDGEGDDGGRVTSKVVLPTWDKRMCPGVAFLDLSVASCLEPLRGRVYGMECCAVVSALVPWLPCGSGIRVGEALTNSMKSSAGLSDALLVMVAILLLCCPVVRAAAECLGSGCVTIAKSRRLAKNMDRAFDRNQSTVSSFLEWKLKARTRHVTRLEGPRHSD